MSSIFIWPSPPKTLDIEIGEVHIWGAHLLDVKGNLVDLRNMLSHDEIQRAQKFFHKSDRENYIAARGSLRDILSLYLKRPASKIEFDYNEFGKPFLTDENCRLSFNVSHSHGLALYAVSRNCKVGIDIEYIPSDFSALNIAERFFSQSEIKTLLEIPSHLQKSAFFNCWARKEAFIKAVGQGISFGLDRFDVSLHPDEPAGLLKVNGSREEASRWFMNELQVDRNFAAAFVIEGGRPVISKWQWPHVLSLTTETVEN